MAKAKKATFTPALELLRPSTIALRDNPLPYLYFAAIPLLILTVGGYMDVQDKVAIGPLTIFGLLLSLALYPALQYTYLWRAQGKTVSPAKALRAGMASFWPLIGLAIVVGLIVFAGLLLFIIPGIIMLRRYFLAPYYLIDRKLSIREAMETSATESLQYSGTVYELLAVFLAITIIGFFGAPGSVASAILSLLFATAPAFRYLEFKKVFKA